MTATESVEVAGTPATTTAPPVRVDATADGDEPVGEAPELTMPRVASLVDRQTQALKEIRGYLTTVDGKRFTVTDTMGDVKVAGEKSCAAVVSVILERHGLA